MSLLLLFSGGGGAEFPNLYVRDVQSGLPVPVGGLAGWDDAFLQSTTICQAPMIFQDKGVIAVGSETGDVVSMRSSRVLTNILFSDSGANCVVRIKYTDQGNEIAYSSSYTINATPIQINTDYIGELLEVDTLGAQKVAVHVVSISAGTVSVGLACV